MSLYQAEGIVLANRDLGEADRVVTLFCREQGKIDAVARGARRPRNRMVGLSLPFNVLRMSIYAGRGLDELSQVEVIRTFQDLRDDLLRLAYASYLAELTREFLPEHEPNPGLYELLLSILAGLEGGREPEPLMRLFELRLLDLTGFRPMLDACLDCGAAPASGANSFSPSAGGFFCRDCRRENSDLIALSGKAMAAMARGLQGDGTSLGLLAPGESAAVQRALRSFIEARLDKELRSLRFLAGIAATPESAGGTQDPGDR